jgi:hypothetical protein
MRSTTDLITEKTRNHPHRDTQEDTDMNAILSSLYRDLTCAAAALLISMVIGASFVHSTATAPGAHAVVATARTANA